MRAYEDYQSIKALLKYHADRETKSDKPYRRQSINDFLDSLIRQDIAQLVQREQISEAQGRLFEVWLTNYAIKRHEK